MSRPVTRPATDPQCAFFGDKTMTVFINTLIGHIELCAIGIKDKFCVGFEFNSYN